MRVASRSRPMCQRQSGSSSLGRGSTRASILSRCSSQALDDAGERVGRGLLEAEVDDGVEAVRARPVDLRVVLVQHVEGDRLHGRAGLGEQLAEAGLGARAGVHLHDLLVRQHDAALVGGGALLAKEQLGGAQPHRVVGAVEHVAQDHVHHLVDEHRREWRCWPGASGAGRRPRRCRRARAHRGRRAPRGSCRRPRCRRPPRCSVSATGRNGSSISASCRAISAAQDVSSGCTSGRVK